MASRTGQKDTVRLALRGCENKETAVYRTARMAVSGGALSGALSRAFFLTEFRNALGKMAGEAAGTETLSLPRRGREDGPGCPGPVL